jgi:hypothetical protein
MIAMLSKLSKKIYLQDRPYPGDGLAQEAFFVFKLPSFLPENYAKILNSLNTTNDKMVYFKNLYSKNKKELGKLCSVHMYNIYIFNISKTEYDFCLAIFQVTTLKKNITAL